MARSKQAHAAELVHAGDLRAELAGLDPRQTEIPGVANPWLLYLASLATSSRQTQSYSVGRAFESCWGWVGPLEAFPWSWLQYGHLVELRSWLAEHRSPATANKVLCAVRGAIRHGWLAGVVPEAHYRQIGEVKGLTFTAPPAGRRLTAGELRSVLGACDLRTELGARDAAMLALAFGCGCRRFELAAMNLSDLDLEAAELRVHGKRRKQRTVPMTAGAVTACRWWLHHRGDERGALFWPTRGGGELVRGRMSREGVQARMGATARRAGVKAFSCHDLRRTFVTSLLEAGADLAIVAELAGHAGLDTTKRYDRRDAAAKRRAVDLLHVPIEVPPELAALDGLDSS
jgi:integrase